MAENRVIGRRNALPWHLPADLKRFKALTMGHAVIIGRKTFDAIGKVLPGRRWIVLTRDARWHRPGVEAVGDLDAAIAALAGEAEVFVAGGAEIYTLALERANRLYATVVHATVDGDARFPALDPSQWRLVDNEQHGADEKHAFAYSFRRYERVSGSGKR
jgi:dihydrofolate reductase